jgi:hypothetical protein
MGGRTANHGCTHVTQAKAFTTLYQVRSLLEKPCGDCRFKGLCLVETEAQVGRYLSNYSLLNHYSVKFSRRTAKPPLVSKMLHCGIFQRKDMVYAWTFEYIGAWTVPTPTGSASFSDSVNPQDSVTVRLCRSKCSNLFPGFRLSNSF